MSIDVDSSRDYSVQLRRIFYGGGIYFRFLLLFLSSPTVFLLVADIFSSSLIHPVQTIHLFVTDIYSFPLIYLIQKSLFIKDISSYSLIYPL